MLRNAISILANQKYCDYITISYNAADGLIFTAVDDGYFMDCCDDYVDVLIDTAINYGDLTDSADITISEYDADGLIATDIDDVYLKNCFVNSAGGLVADIHVVYLTDRADITISDNAADGFISADAGYLTDCADTIV